MSTVAPSSTNAVTPIEEGCTTSQHKCDDGDGCCNNDQSCTNVSGTGYCAASQPTETDRDLVDDDDGGSSGLSDGAKAGIAVGAVVGAALIIGIFTWLCIYSPRRRRPSGTGSRGSGGRQVENAVGMSEATPASPPRQGGAGLGLTQDYFGPDPGVGPYTETPDQREMHGSSVSPGHYRAVPSRPDQPGDITAPVEMDSESRYGDGRFSPTSNPSSHASPPPVTIPGRFELYGELEPPAPPRSPSILETPVAWKPRKEDEL